jgi:hypothetical protein
MLSLGPSSCSAWRSTRKPGQEWQLAQAIADWRLFGEPNRDSVHVIGPRGLLREECSDCRDDAATPASGHLDVIANKL